MKLNNTFRAFFFSILLIAILSCEDKTETCKEFDSSFVHVVYFWLNDPSSSEDRTAFENSLRNFLDNSEFAKTNFIGTPPFSTRDVVDDSFTYCLIVTFESAEAQDKYQEEPAHLQFIDESSPLWERVVVYDAIGE